MDDKFILTSLNDKNSKNIAEVLGNKTCKKILDFLADIKEASEKDISSKLNIPINTVEYNLNKLIKSGLVDKTKNFFWSVKGKKIPMYKLAKKHIIIGYKKPSLNYLKSILPVLFIGLAVFALILSFFPEYNQLDDNQLRQFNSDLELRNFIMENSEQMGFFEGLLGGSMKARSFVDTAPVAGSFEGDVAMAEVQESGTDDYSTTNIQVQGVDEADIVKNDGKYIYVVSGNKVNIINAYPAEDMKILSEIELEGVSEIFINDNKLIVFATGYGGSKDNSYIACAEGPGVRRGCFYEEPYNFIYIYDILDKENPELDEEISIDGSYVSSRMIGDYVYVISTKYANVNNPEPPVYAVNGLETKIRSQEVHYWNYPDTSYVFTNIMSINVNGKVNSKVYLTGATNNIYVSQDNIYLTYQKRTNYEDYVKDLVEKVYLPIFSKKYDDKINDILDSDEEDYIKMDLMREVVDEYVRGLDSNELSNFSKELEERLEEFNQYMQKKMDKTIVHKINVYGKDIEYKGVGEVPGMVLNQFSMDEYNSYFRIATTTGNSWDGGSLNHLYVLDEDLEIVGSVEDLAEGERIYSVRFLGKRVYVVTFRNIDPLFVIDLEDPENPEVLGYLKVTGYSDYLHIYDENHVIGLGKETRGGNEDFSWYQGIKISLFDVSDVKNPIERAKIEIGDRGTDSIALYEHKAFLFDKSRNLLVIPISLAEVDKNDYNNQFSDEDSAYGKTVWEGAYVIDIRLNGIEVRGKITHNDEIGDNINKGMDDYWYFPYENQIKRSLYIDDVLYTISNKIVKANDLQTIDEISSIELDYEEDYPLVYY